MATISNREGLLSHKRMYPHSQNDKYIKEYVDMVTNPGGAKTVRAPAISPYIASTTHVRRVVDLTGPETNAGSYAIFMTPNNIFPYETSGALANFPAVSATISGATSYGASPLNGTGCKLTVRDTSGTSVSILSSAVSYTSVSYPCWPVAFPAGTYSAQVSCFQGANSPAVGTAYDFRLYAGVAGVWTAVSSTQRVICAQTYPNFTFTIPVGGSMSLAAVHTDSFGTPTAGDLSGCVLTFQATGQLQPSGSMVQSYPNASNIISLESSQTLSHRIVAMSMLVSNLASDLNNQGRVVIGRADPRVLQSYTTLAEGQAALSRLPDPSRVFDGPLRDGGYAWYMPDDINSYEPHSSYQMEPPINTISCFISGMDVTDGSVRIIMDYVVEFYTPNQLLTRDPSPIWDDQLLEVFGELLCAPAASANFAHAALLSAVAAGALRAAKFYAQNKSWIDPAVAGAYRAVVNKVKEVDQQSKNNQSKKAQRPKR